ncbi:uncharacterized protein ACIB01_017121 [Guaruba guarouba]
MEVATAQWADLDLLMSSGYSLLYEQSPLFKATGASHGLLKFLGTSMDPPALFSWRELFLTTKCHTKDRALLSIAGLAGWRSRTDPAPGVRSSSLASQRNPGRKCRGDTGFAGSACIFPCPFHSLPCQHPADAPGCFGQSRPLQVKDLKSESGVESSGCRAALGTDSFMAAGE